MVTESMSNWIVKMVKCACLEKNVKILVDFDYASYIVHVNLVWFYPIYYHVSVIKTLAIDLNFYDSRKFRALIC